MTYSLYLIGSTARGEAHELSDVDYVCVFDDEKPTRPEFLQPNVNVSFYSRRRLQWMLTNSKLFIKHILLDGKVVVEQAEHRKLLESFAIDKSILKADLANFKRMADRLEWAPAFPIGMLWAADYVYSIARNIVFISNALEDYFEFDYRRACKFYLKEQTDLISDFMRIRQGKYDYRLQSHIDVKFDLYPSINEVLTRIASKKKNLQIGGRTRFELLPKNSYESLRLVERAIINQEISDQNFIAKLKHHGDYAFELRKIANSVIDLASTDSS